MAINPFTMEFGVQPPEYIDRFGEMTQIKEDFSSAYPSTHFYAILGPRGSGKTVMLNDIYDGFKNKEGWIAVDLNCGDDLLLQLAASLDDKVRSLHEKWTAEFSFSFSFLSVTLKGKEHVSSLPVLLEKMLEKLDKHNVKVLVTIDDVANNDHVAVFAKQFQSLRGKKMPIFLVMTGLYSVFNYIQGGDGLTFLQRASKVYLGPLNKRAIAKSYQEVLNVPYEKALSLAEATKGYAFAYQCIGFLLVKYGKTELDDFLLSKLDYYLEEGVYSKLFEELTSKEREFLAFVAKEGSSSNQSVIAAGIVNKNTISNMKDQLSRKGLILLTGRGTFELALPRFGELLLTR